ncbi:MAG: hypothetical protein JWL80_26 [Parcubacteria group bacterium]|nr:hypothetical protein [Parcubacteria group bacterium]
MFTQEFRNAVACAAVVFLSACGGGPTQPSGNTGIVNPPPPPSTEKLSLSISSVPASTIQGYQSFPMASLVAQVSATSSKEGAVVTKACKVDNTLAPCGPELVLGLGVGNHVIKLIGTSSFGAVDSVEVTTTVLPATITCRKIVVNTAMGEYVPQGYIYADNGPGTVRDSAKVNADGSCSLNTRYAATPRAHITIPGDGTMGTLTNWLSSTFYSNLVIVGKAKSFTIPSGESAGRVVPIDMVKGTKRVPWVNGTSLYNDLGNASVSLFGMGSYKSFPVCAAFMSMSNGSTEAITSADSVAFWTNVDDLEKKLGVDLLKPCSEATVKANGGISIFLKVGQVTSEGGVGVGYFDDYVSGFINFSGHYAFASALLVQHELGHALFGLDHTCEWTSVMRSSCPVGVPDQVTTGVEDVAYILEKIQSAALARKYGANQSLGLGFVINGARVSASPALPELNIPVLDTRGNPIP